MSERCLYSPTGNCIGSIAASGYDSLWVRCDWCAKVFALIPTGTNEAVLRPPMMGAPDATE